MYQRIIAVMSWTYGAESQITSMLLSHPPFILVPKHIRRESGNEDVRSRSGAG